MGAYVVSDRASWLNFGNKDDLALLFSGDPALFNQYSLLPVAPAKNDRIRNDLAIELEAWLTSPRAADLINNYTINGEKLFVFNAVTD
jgi:tungstate transport system substrate-binding protein